MDSGSDDKKGKDEIQYIREWPPPVRQQDQSCENSAVLPKNLVENKEMIRPKRNHHGFLKCSCQEKTNVDKSVYLPTAMSDLAKWWKSKKAKGICQVEFPKGCTGKSAISFIASTKEGHVFLSSSLHKLQQVISVNPESYKPIFLLGTYYDLLGYYHQSLQCYERAMELQPKNSELKWYWNKAKKNIDTLLIQTKFIGQNNKDAALPFEVERRDCSLLSSEEFFFKYELTSTPVVITGLASHITEQLWTLSFIKNKLGKTPCTLKHASSWSKEWAKLELVEGSHNVGDFIDSLGDNRDTTNNYLFDWSLPINAPELLINFKVPKYFANDLLQRTPCGTLYQDSWPSLFIAPKGAISDLHVDAFNSNFWMALFAGKKKWTFFPKDDLPLLYPKYENSMDATFDVNILRPSYSERPLFKFARRIECILEEGEILFVPHGCPHHVENLETSVAISSNFVDVSNVGAVIDALSCDALIDPRASELLSRLKNNEFSKGMHFLADHVQWNDFKNPNLTLPDNFDTIWDAEHGIVTKRVSK